jgi:hypothetical protein
MSTYLMWEYLRRKVGKFHQARSESKMAEMKAKGYFDATNVRGTDLPYPTGTQKADLTYSIAFTVDADNPMKLHFDATPTGKGGLYNFGDTKTFYAANGEAGHTYAAEGDYTVTFHPEDGSPSVTLDATVAAAAPPEVTP